ncbi:MAG: aspartate kinase [Acidobacteriota bacterium]|nr:aspartate kinase [Acidobacteriota bacterium]
MIVMKFGGASLASPISMRRVVSIVQSQLARDPLVVVSALGDTTDHLLELLSCASQGHSYQGWKCLEQLQTYHFCLAEDLLDGAELNEIENYLRQVFRDLHVQMLELSEGERSSSPELRDWVLALGEQISSKLVASVFRKHDIPAAHLDARSLIITDQQFTRAEPRYWETYARIRWAVPSAGSRVAVLGGFIGATEDGRTTTLGRGGSDLTASLIGAALNAEEVQVWKDVDGLLTWDPKIHSGAGYRVKQLSYEEMADLASAGATILHPDTIAPLQRLRIPITIRNTFRPECEGTKIGSPQPGSVGTVKSIACKTDITLLELRQPKEHGLQQYARYLEILCQQRMSGATFLGMTPDVIYLAIEGTAGVAKFEFNLEQCAEVHVRSRQAILILVGDGLRNSSTAERVLATLTSSEALILPANSSSRCVCISVPTRNLARSLAALVRILFAEADSRFFADSRTSRSEEEQEQVDLAMVSAPKTRPQRDIFVLAHSGTRT